MFGWVGVAAPAQLCFRGTLQWVTARLPLTWRFCLWPDTRDPLTHRGSGRVERRGMTAPPRLIAGSRDACGPSDLGSVTLRSPLDPIVGGSLEDGFAV